jgi:hypothetical protein
MGHMVDAWFCLDGRAEPAVERERRVHVTNGQVDLAEGGLMIHAAHHVSSRHAGRRLTPR